MSMQMPPDDIPRIFIGWDQSEAVAYSVLSYSIQRRASRPVSITPVALHQLKDTFQRDWHDKQSNEFAFSRFLVPSLCGYQGWALWMDCDMLCLADICDLWDHYRDEDYAVRVVRHHHEPTETTKYLGRPQTAYRCKNWSSVVLFNCARCTTLTEDYVNTASGLDLHRFKWLSEKREIGKLPRAWNHLVDVDPQNANAKLVHWTVGGPWFFDYSDREYALEWFQEYRSMTHADQIVREIPIKKVPAR